jgi:glucokinase
MDEWPYPALLADVGGTQVRFAIAENAQAAPGLIRVLRTADHAGLTEAAMAYLALVGRSPATSTSESTSVATPSAAVPPAAPPLAVLPGRVPGDVSVAAADPGKRSAPTSAALAVATPVAAARLGPIRLTNTAFTIDGAQLMGRLHLSALWIVNDFEALAWSLPTLSEEELEPIGATMPTLDTTMAVIGPGTGLGCAGLLRNAAGWHAIPGEGGHVTLSGRTGFERDVLAAAADQMDHVSAEKLLSGIGMPLLFRAVAAVRGDPAAAGPLPAPTDITARAIAGTDPLCREVVETFCALLGVYAGNVALVYGATGGVLIGGGIATHVAGLLAGSAFRSRFEDKGRFSSYLGAIGTARITRAQPALDGLVYALRTALPSLPVQRRPSAAERG